MNENDKIIDMARALGRAIQMDDRFMALQKVRDDNDADTALQELIGQFNVARLDLNNELAKEGRNDARIAELNGEVQRLYDDVMNIEGMMRYESKKVALEDLFSYINAIITTAVNGGDVETVTQPEECGGDCGGCSGCN